MTWQWNIVRELDRADRPEFLPITAFYVGTGIQQHVDDVDVCILD